VEAPLGPVHCRGCGATWQAVHVFLAEEECIRCGGELAPVEGGPDWACVEHDLLMRSMYRPQSRAAPREHALD
jgi:hypothetical protein